MQPVVMTFGVIGPTDLAGWVAEIVQTRPGLVPVVLGYHDEREAPKLVAEAAEEVDAWLFTGVVPHQLAKTDSRLDRPAEHVSYSGYTLMAALFRLAAEGRDLSRMSIDTLTSGEVSETLAVAGLPVLAAETMPYQPGIGSGDFVRFHRQAAQQRFGGTTAITCLRSTYDVLQQEMPVTRLTPTYRDICDAVQALELRVRSRQHADAQVVLGLVDLDTPDPDLEQHLAELAATVTPTSSHRCRYLLVTTQGPLATATDNLQAAPFLHHLAARHTRVHVGLGLGGSAANAEANARRALARAHLHGDIAAVLAAPHDKDRLLARKEPTSPARTDPSLLAARIGMTTTTLQAVRNHLRQHDTKQITSRDLAAALGIQERTARRHLQRLERAGAATPAGTSAQGQIGRPPTIYRVDL